MADHPRAGKLAQTLLTALIIVVCLAPLARSDAARRVGASEGAPPKVASGQSAPQPQDNLFLFTTVADLERGTNDGTQVLGQKDGTAALTLRDASISGTYTSPRVQTKPFDRMILSWNADTPGGTYIEVQGRVRAGGQWSKWLSWGHWSASAFAGDDGVTIERGSAAPEDAEDNVARVAIDELSVKGGPTRTADMFQYRLILHGVAAQAGRSSPRASTGPLTGTSAGGILSPDVFLVAATLRNTLVGQAVPKVYPPGLPDMSHLDVDLDVPAFSQAQQDPSIAGSICSPTSMAMVLSYHGIDISPETVAWGVRDYSAGIFGDWPFNTAYAGSRGLKAYVDYLVPDPGADPWYPVKREIAAGNPVVVSVVYRKPGYSGSDWPEVAGVPINSTDGHLVVIRGFTWQDGVEFVIVNDPAARTSAEVRRLYRADQFFDAWVDKVAYLVH